jgi:subtilase family serine protease
MLNQLKRGMRSARRKGEGHGFATQIEHLEERQLLSGSPSPTALTPAEISDFYGFSDITFTQKLGAPKGPSGGTITVPGNGNGQTIAIIDWYQDPNIQNDVNVFDQQFGLPPLNLTVDKLASVPKTLSNSWAEEESLDVEWAHAVAPAATLWLSIAAPRLTTFWAPSARPQTTPTFPSSP